MNIKYYIIIFKFKVVENLYIGSQDAAAEEEILTTKGITHIVNVGTGIPNMFEHVIKKKKLNFFFLYIDFYLIAKYIFIMLYI